MAITLESAALNVYRNAAFDNGNTIINNDGAGIKANGVYSGAFSAVTRSAAEKAANNAARTELLKALGRAFNVEGMTEVDGKVTFSREFMSRFEKILGAEFKSGDFGVNSKGEITSGKPLTMRRIKAIVGKADLVGHGSFSISVYEKKLEAIMKDLKIGDIENLPAGKNECKPFALAKKALEFLKYEADKTISLHPGYEFEVYECGNDYHGPRYQYYDRVADEQKSLTGFDEYDRYLQNRLGGVPVHVFMNATSFDRARPETISKVKDYVGGIMQLFVKSVIDNYFDAKAAGKMDEYKACLRDDLGVCLENKCRELDAFAGRHLITQSREDIAAAAEAERIADTAIVNGAAPKQVQNLICDVIGELIQLDAKYAEFDDWNDFAEEVKKRLTGRNATITAAELRNGEYVFEPVMNDGKILVRQLTAADIDALGPVCLKVINGED